MGGLGNQLFQAAQGFAIEQLTGQKVFFDTGLLTVSPQARSLAIRGLIADRLIASPAWVSKAIAATGAIRVNRFVKILRDTSSIRNAEEIRSVIVLLGYFQDLGLVDSVADILFQRFRYFEPFSTLAERDLVDRIGLHVRLGDYVTDFKARNFHGATAPSYYIQAAETLRASSGVEKVRIVSDDMVNANRLIAPELRKRGFEVSLKGGSDSADHDLSILAHSTHVICSNSTFSWWAGWAASRKYNSVVVVPRPWFAVRSDIEERLFDPNWIVVDREIIQIK